MQAKEFIAIDGDDVGPQLRTLIVHNDVEGASKLSKSLVEFFNSLRFYLERQGCTIVFCGGDSVLASNYHSNLDVWFDSLLPGPCTISIGIGPTPEYAYLALQSAKARGKNRVVRVRNKMAQTIHKWSGAKKQAGTN